jgi:hypothetical protein
MTEEEREQAQEDLERLTIDQQRRSQRRGYRGPSLGTEKRMAELQLRSEGVDPSQFDSRKAYDIAINERMAAEREARGPMAFSTAEGRLIPMRPEVAPSPLTQTPNLRFPATQGVGGELGMDRERINQAAMNEAMRLGGGRVTDESRAQVIQTPYGIMSSRSEFSPAGGSQRMTQADFESSAGGLQGFDRPERYTATPTGGFQREFSGADDRALAMAGMAERGAAIRSSLEEQSRGRAYAFRQGMAERKAQEAMAPRGSQPVTEGQKRRGEQYLAQAAEYREIGAGRRRPMSRKPLNVGGTQVRRSGMGQYTPIVDPSRIGAFPAPTTPMASAAFGGMGSQIGNTIFDSFDSNFGEFNFTDPFGFSRKFGAGSLF